MALNLAFVITIADEVTLVFGGLVSNPQSGSVQVKLGEYAFDVHKDRRELVREVYSICAKPPTKIQEFINNRLNANSYENQSVYVWYYHPNKKGKSTSILQCSFNKDGLYSLNGIYTPKRSGETINTMVQQIIKNNSFSYNFVQLIDCANIERIAKDIPSTAPSKILTLKFGAKVVDSQNGQEFIADLGDLLFDVYKDRRELVREVYAHCLKPNEQMKQHIDYEINKGKFVPHISLYYLNPNLDTPSLVKIEQLTCYFNDKGLYSIGDIFTPNQRNQQGIKKQNDLVEAIVEGQYKTLYSHDFVNLVDAALFEEYLKAETTKKPNKKHIKKDKK